MSIQTVSARFWGAGIVAALTALAVAAFLTWPNTGSQSNTPPAEAPPPTPVSVATVEQRDVVLWDEFSGRLEAIERVEIRPRVSGTVQAVHFREGALVKKGDLLITIDPATYAAEVDRAEAQVAAAEARLALAGSDLERGQQLWNSRTVSQRDLDQRVNAQREAAAALRAAQAALQSARLNLGYTEIRAPVTGRVGRLEITVGNQVAAGPGTPVLTTLVSVDPIYASFSADEAVVMRALRSLPQGAMAQAQVGSIPVRMVTATSNGTTHQGRLQLIDNQVDPASGTVRVRAVFDNADGSLMPGQFARLGMGEAATRPVVMVNERAVGTDQSKKFVMVVADDNRAAYREVALGAPVDGLRIVSSGLKPGERIIVNGLQRVRPGAPVAPRLVPMLAQGDEKAGGG